MNKLRAMALQWLGGVPITPESSGFWSHWYGQANSAGQAVTEKSVLSLSAAWACTRLIAESAATLPIKIYEKTPDGRRVASDLSIYNVLHTSPNANSTPVTFFESMVATMLLQGNAFAEKLVIGGRLVGLQFLSSGRLSITRRADFTFRYLYADDNGRQREIPESRIWHCPGFSMDGRWGVSVIQYGSGVFGSALAAQSAANNSFEKGLSPTVAFTVDRVIRAEQRAEFREYFKGISGAMNAGEAVVLEKGMDSKILSIPPKDAQVLETRLFSVEEVCRWFRVDPTMVGHGGKDSNFGTGLEQKMLGFLTFTLRPWLTRIEQSINANLLTPVQRQQYYAEFSIEGLLRADSKSRAEFYRVMVDHGLFTRDEVREMENRPRKGGNADVLTVHTAMAPLEDLGNNTNSFIE